VLAGINKKFIVPNPIRSDKKKIPTPEEVMENWGRITSLDNPRFFNQLMEMTSVLKK
jgi:hypothetical protein